MYPLRRCHIEHGLYILDMMVTLLTSSIRNIYVHVHPPFSQCHNISLLETRDVYYVHVLLCFHNDIAKFACKKLEKDLCRVCNRILGNK